MAKIKTKIVRCYEVWVEDEEGTMLDYQYVYGDRKEAEEMGRNLKKQAALDLAEQEREEAEYND